MTTVFYARVSTAEQKLEHQQTQAEQMGFEFDLVLSDQGVSGVNVPIRQRPQGARLFDILRSGDVLCVRWIDRLGRNYEDVTATIRELVQRGVIIRTVINNMTFDGSTKDPMQKAIRDAMISFMAAMAQAQTEATKIAQKAGIAAAKESGDVYRGRKPSFSRSQYEAVQSMLQLGHSVSKISKETGITRQTVYRIKNDPVACEKTLMAWNL